MTNFRTKISQHAVDMGVEYGPCRYMIETDDAIKICEDIAEQIKQDFITAGQKGLFSKDIVEHVIVHINEKYLNKITEIV